MTIFIHSSVFRRTALALILLGVLGACHKDDSSAGQAANSLTDVARQASEKLDQAASFVGQQVDSARATAQQHIGAAASAALSASAASGASAPGVTLNPDALASSAQAHLRGAASAVLGKAAGLTGAGLETAGRKLQEWSSQTSAAGSDPASEKKSQ
ncbi:hypothetical protein QS306_06325 [Paraburkholderia bonniea]|uniref:hypothetical protein n=1 Tax=Paraburkholderia bonniea TaxID=2152891 RepID=UPI0012914BD8|nr:hypothetical protein [Paraburkholderia bonniea]WJF91245.1 hypothetical protein QS306_06325 [Paraburkholderia bonniea]WJF94560.1 hypothetical protein QS308_06335 [Paraburkholderia bonniea]